MADRSSARLFGVIFTHLADDPTPANRKFAWEIWDIKEEMGCDFNDYQMDADDELVTLGLARELTEDGGIAYAGEEYGPERPESFGEGS